MTTDKPVLTVERPSTVAGREAVEKVEALAGWTHIDAWKGELEALVAKAENEARAPYAAIVAAAREVARTDAMSQPKHTAATNALRDAFTRLDEVEKVKA